MKYKFRVQNLLWSQIYSSMFSLPQFLWTCQIFLIYYLEWIIFYQPSVSFEQTQKKVLCKPVTKTFLFLTLAILSQRNASASPQMFLSPPTPPSPRSWTSTTNAQTLLCSTCHGRLQKKNSEIILSCLAMLSWRRSVFVLYILIWACFCTYAIALEILVNVI